MTQAAESPPITVFAVIIAVPPLMILTNPFSSTDAIELSLDDHVTLSRSEALPFAPRTDAVS